MACLAEARAWGHMSLAEHAAFKGFICAVGGCAEVREFVGGRVECDVLQCGVEVDLCGPRPKRKKKEIAVMSELERGAR